jgi:hypothetical protein
MHPGGRPDVAARGPCPGAFPSGWFRWPEAPRPNLRGLRGPIEGQSVLFASPGVPPRHPWHPPASSESTPTIASSRSVTRNPADRASSTECVTQWSVRDPADLQLHSHYEQRPHRCTDSARAPHDRRSEPPTLHQHKHHSRDRRRGVRPDAVVHRWTTSRSCWRRSRSWSCASAALTSTR